MALKKGDKVKLSIKGNEKYCGAYIGIKFKIVNIGFNGLEIYDIVEINGELKKTVYLEDIKGY